MPVRVAKEAVVQNVDEDILEFEDTGSPVGTPTKERMRAISETEKSVLGKQQLTPYLILPHLRCRIHSYNLWFLLVSNQSKISPIEANRKRSTIAEYTNLRN